MKPTIGLCVIMKNEEQIISRMLNSVVDIIDYYVVVDTGSTDKSKKIVKEFFDLRGVKGEIHDHGWINYGDARNFAIEKLSNKADFGFIIDADEIIKTSKNFSINSLKNQLDKIDFGLIKIEHNQNIYSRGAFYRTNKGFKYHGAVHEVLISRNQSTEGFIENISIVQSHDGNTWTKQSQIEKYIGHAEILQNYIKENGADPRSVFYLAQSYRDAMEKEKAIEWYSKRLGMDGFYEERYISQLNIARLKWELEKPIHEVADAFMLCSEFDELRSEHLFSLKLMYERNGRPKSALKIEELIGKYKNPYPHRKLFIEKNAYVCGIA